MKNTKKKALTVFLTFQYIVFAVYMLLRTLCNDFDFIDKSVRSWGESSEFIHDFRDVYLREEITESSAFPTILLGALAIAACVYMAVVCRKTKKYSCELIIFAVLCCVAFRPTKHGVLGLLLAAMLIYSIVKFIYIARLVLCEKSEKNESKIINAE